MSGTYDSRTDTLAHIHLVRDNIEIFVNEPLTRGRVRDARKFSAVEKPVLDKVMPLLDDVSYGSPKWRSVVDQAGPALGHHYRHNSHHPEHYRNAGVAGMDLFDIVEMVCDWVGPRRVTRATA